MDSITFGTNSAGSRLETSVVDGGAKTRIDASGSDGLQTPAQGKDCVDADTTSGTASNPVVIENSEIRFCHDRGIKSKSGYLKVQNGWIHNNLRGGLFAQSPLSGSTDGVIDAVANIVEQNGINCPNGTNDLAACGTQSVARSDAAEASAEGTMTRLVTNGNIVRDGAARGLFFQNQSRGDIDNDFVCGISNGSNGKGIQVQKSSGAISDIVVRGSAVVFNDDAGVRLENDVAADFGTAASPGQNAFARNSSGTDRNFRAIDNVMDAPAAGNQWEHCYPVSDPNQNNCDEGVIGNIDTNNATGMFDRVDVADAQVHAGETSAQPTTVGPILPLKAAKGRLVSITGSGFNAIGALTSPPGTAGLPVNDDCTVGVDEGNSCDSPITGTCVEFNEGDGWRPAAKVLAVTPQHIVVESPITCTKPTMVRIRRMRLDGGEVVAPSGSGSNFCRNSP